jgi:hypothetical protein
MLAERCDEARALPLWASDAVALDDAASSPAPREPVLLSERELFACQWNTLRPHDVDSEDE